MVALRCCLHYTVVHTPVGLFYHYQLSQLRHSELAQGVLQELQSHYISVFRVLGLVCLLIGEWQLACV